MSALRISVCAALTGAMLVANSAFAGFTGIVVEEKALCGGDLPAGVTHVCNVYAQFDSAPGNRIISVAGTPDFPMVIQVLGGGTFYQHFAGSDAAPSQALIDAFPELACDTFVSIGKKTGEGDMTIISPGIPGFLPSSMGGTDGAWVVTPKDQQGEPDGSLRVLLGQFTVENGTGVEGAFLIQAQSDGDPDFRQYVSFSCPLGAADPTGACTIPAGACVQTSADLCEAIGGSYQGDGAACAEIPTVSEWGLIAMSLLILSAGALMLHRRVRVAAHGRTLLLLMACSLILVAPFALAYGPCPADIDGSGAVDILDLLTLLADWGNCCVGDLNGDGTTDVDDLLDLLGMWGPC